MLKIQMAIAIFAMLLISCSKSTQSPAPIIETTPKHILFSIYVNPDASRDPQQTSASIHLTVLKTTISGIRPVLVYDTLIPMRSLLDYPGPKEPLVFATVIDVRGESNELLHLNYQTLYKVNQKLETVSGTEKMPAHDKEKTFEVKL